MQPSVKPFELTNEFYIDEGCYIVEFSNSNDDPELSIARVRVEPGVTTELHHLQNITERYVIIEGEGMVEIGSLSPQTVRVGDVVIIPPMCAQRITNTGTNDLIFLAICTPRFNTEHYQKIEDEAK